MAIYKSRGLKKAFSYGVVGVFGATVHFLTLIVMVQRIHLNPILGSSLGFILALIFSFMLNAKYTFQVQPGRTSIRFAKYTVVSVMGFLLNMFIMYVTLHVLGIYYLIGQSIVTAVLPINNFLLNNFWTFRTPTQ